MGASSEPFDPIIPPETPHVRRNFAEPIGAPETIARYVGVLVEQLSADTGSQRAWAPASSTCCLYRVDNRIQAIRVGTSRPVRDIKRLTKLLCDQIEKIDPGFGIETMTLTAMSRNRCSTAQPHRSLGEPECKDVSGLIDTLSNRIGESQLYRLAPVRKRYSGTRGQTGDAAVACLRRQLAAALATPSAPAGPARTYRNGCTAARSSACGFYLAGPAPARGAGRRAGTHLWRMVESGYREERGSGLFPGRR